MYNSEGKTHLCKSNNRLLSDARLLVRIWLYFLKVAQATDVVLSDKHFILKASSKNWRCLDYAGKNLKESREFMMQAINEANGGKGIRVDQIPQW